MIHRETTGKISFSMDRTERFYKIEHLIRSQGCVSFAALLEALEVSPATLKRDLAYLRERWTRPSSTTPARTATASASSGAAASMSCRACGSTRPSCMRC
jgi:hypothetical protein